MPIRSDIDLLVLGAEPVEDETREELVNETFSLSLECGGRIGTPVLHRRLVRAAAGEPPGFVARLREEGRFFTVTSRV